MALATSFAGRIERGHEPVICAVCRRPADRFTMKENFENRDVRFVVLCHGNVDDFTIYESAIEDVRRGAQIIAFIAHAAGLALMQEDRD